VISALPPKADIAERYSHVRFVPKADIGATEEGLLTIADIRAGSDSVGRTNSGSLAKFSGNPLRLVFGEQFRRRSPSELVGA
jgi:hypothetical protein